MKIFASANCKTREKFRLISKICAAGEIFFEKCLLYGDFQYEMEMEIFNTDQRVLISANPSIFFLFSIQSFYFLLFSLNFSSSLSG